MNQFPIFEADLEIRQADGRRILSGLFKYNSLGTISDRGRVRKETFSPGAFDFSIDDAAAKIDVLVGHDFGRPLASRQAGSLSIESTADAVRFEAILPERAPSWITDAELAIDAGLATGLSPGFRIPPPNVVRNAVELVPEPGNPSVQVRRINHAVLREFSVVTNAVYGDAEVELRSEDWPTPDNRPSRFTLWL